LGNAFIVYLPKDIVAGDFYWVDKKNHLIYFGVCDCTGHGVPGAIVSVLCHNALSRSLNEFQEFEPGKILDKTKEILISHFNKSNELVQDGMDASIGCINLKEFSMSWSGANLPLWIIREGNLIEFKPDKQAIAMDSSKNPFHTIQIQLKKGDCIYAFTDGYADQFGGSRGKKLTRSGLKNILIAAHLLSPQEQKQKLTDYFYSYKQNEEQVDDICVMGIQI
jgi:serine phosphatase RsbU (regulator of sigma subunit)